MLPRIIFNITRRTICTNTHIFYVLKNTAKLNLNQCNLCINFSYPQQNLNSMIFKRFKSQRSASKQGKYAEEIDEDKDEDEVEDKDEDEDENVNEDDNDDDDNDDDDDDHDHDDDGDSVNVDDYLNTSKSKVITISVLTLRVDAIAKAAFKMSRAKLDKEFYKSNLYLNGQKCLKKSTFIKVGDELDYIQCRSPNDANLLKVHRCVPVSITANLEMEFIKVKMIVNKSLLVENYSEAWKQKG